MSDDECPMGCGNTTEDVAGGPCNACWNKAPRPGFASYCPHCHTGDPGEDYCASCGEAI